ncbi:MAG: hypothetical protein ACTHU0_40190 [Kofleriaceae bacterium]
MRLRVLVVLGFACAGSPPPAVVENRAPPPPPPECSDDRVAEITDALRARWNVVDHLVVRCTAGTFPEPGYFVEALGSRDESIRIGVLAADRVTELVPFVERRLGVATSVLDYAAADLDGDGIDEVLETWRRSAHGPMGSDNWVVVRRIENKQFAEIQGPHLSVYFPDLGNCTASTRLEGRTLVVEVESASGIPPSACLSIGRHAFAMRDGALVEVK